MGPGPATNGVSGKGSEDPALKEVMSQINSSFPADQKSKLENMGFFSTGLLRFSV